MTKCITCKQDKPFTVLSKTYPQCEDCYNLVNPKTQAKDRIIKTLQVFDFSLEQLSRIEEIINE